MLMIRTTSACSETVEAGARSICCCSNPVSYTHLIEFETFAVSEFNGVLISAVFKRIF